MPRRWMEKDERQNEIKRERLPDDVCEEERGMDEAASGKKPPIELAPPLWRA